MKIKVVYIDNSYQSILTKDKVYYIIEYVEISGILYALIWPNDLGYSSYHTVDKFVTLREINLEKIGI